MLLVQRCKQKGGVVYEPRDYASYAVLRQEIKRKKINTKLWIGLRYRKGKDGLGRSVVQ